MESTESTKQTATLKELKRCSKSFEAVQQALILSLLNVNGVGFKVRRPERRSQKTLQLFLVEELNTKTERILFEKNVDEFCAKFVREELKESNYTALTPTDVDSIASITRAATNGISVERLKQIKRHRDANKTSTSFNWLMERCEKFGYQFKKRSTKPTKYTQKLNKICGVCGKAVMTMVEISEIGRLVNEIVYKRFEKASSFVQIPQNDPEIEQVVRETEKILLKESQANVEPFERMLEASEEKKGCVIEEKVNGESQVEKAVDNEMEKEKSVELVTQNETHLVCPKQNELPNYYYYSLSDQETFFVPDNKSNNYIQLMGFAELNNNIEAKQETTNQFFNIKHESDDETLDSGFYSVTF
ncbi:hypothetical protein EIN_054190 [Entamoeba invadens IP1]|uniref:hypothetical protein n=1 Tax=Entamoeba invadens IP1 TaxID=370355 RepID=UPI0002C3E284|nr:hypothetical protein EIN_054190 [Entamoeba invadens IP1]ELP93144.1 hypothetical protein EIN_054190 [Entamoeba invadens IP1]|eukprot:XP_004259915.1 hypothetical protein EIN_054190 [Entamoeba invadens IP1]